MFKVFFSVLIMTVFASSLYSDDIDNLLSDFKQASDLSFKTKDEVIGNLIVYTRDDLERMQANTLKDVLKSMRYLNYQESRLGQPDLFNADPLLFNSSSVRIYLNNHELYSPLVGSGFGFFGDIELDFVDHIEIYQGFPSFDFGTEAATIVVRLYSKTSEHHTGSRLKLQAGSYGANSQSAYNAGEVKGLSYFAYASRRDNQRKETSHDNQKLSRDARTERLYLSLSSQNHSLEIHGSNMNGDAFMGSFISIDSNVSSPDSTSLPDNSEINHKFISAALKSTFQEKSLILTASAMTRETHIRDTYTSPLAYRPYSDGISQLQVNASHQNMNEESYTLGLTKKFETSNNTFTAGAKFRHKRFDLDSSTLDSFIYTPPSTSTPGSLNDPQPFSTTDIYTLFAQDEYSIDEHQLISLSLMVQHYHNRHTSVDDYHLLQRRIGYVYTKDEWIAKTFVSHEEFAPEPYFTVTDPGQYSNENLKKSSYLSAFQEVAYKTSSTHSKIVFGYTKTKDLPLLDSNFQLQNSTEDVHAFRASVEETISFNQNDKLELQAYVVSIDSPLSDSFKSNHGGMIRMLNTYRTFDVFNELVIREKSSSLVQNAHDYSAGIIYHVTQDLQFNLKGENLFDDGYEQAYINQIDSSTGQIDYLIAPVIQRRIWLGMELLF